MMGERGGGREGGAYRSRRYTHLSFHPPRFPHPRHEGLSASRLFILGNFLPRPPPPRHPVLPISPPNPALSRHIECYVTAGEIYGYFAKWLNALPDYGAEGGGSGARCRRRPDRDIGYGIVEFHCRIPPAWRARFRGLLRFRIPVAYSALNACLPDPRTSVVQISDVSLGTSINFKDSSIVSPFSTAFDI